MALLADLRFVDKVCMVLRTGGVVILSVTVLLASTMRSGYNAPVRCVQRLGCARSVYLGG